jgi:hypothetical protein
MVRASLEQGWARIISCIAIISLIFISPIAFADEQKALDCKSTLSSPLKALKPIANFVNGLNSQCEEQAEQAFYGNPLVVGHTLTDLIAQPWRSNLGPTGESEDNFALQIGGGVELLANKINVVRSIVEFALTSQEGAAIESVDGEELILSFGEVGSVVAKADFMAGLMPYLVRNMLSSDFPLPTDEGDITLTFNLNSGFAGIDIDTILAGTTLLQGGESVVDLLDIDQITVKISNGQISSEAELDPEDLSFNRGQLGLNFDFGPNSISSTTIFSKGQGLEKQILQLTAQMGTVDLLGQATFSSNLPEFKVAANLADLLSVSARITEQGFLDPTLSFDFGIPFLKKN